MKENFENINYPTPFFIFSKKKINEKYQYFKQNFPDSQVFYAMKANSEIEVLQTLLDAGSGFEVGSIYELEILKRIGVSPDKIIYGSALKSSDHIKIFFEYGVRIFAFDSFAELQKIAIVAPGSKVYVRLSVDDAGSVFQFSEKFGTDKESVTPMLVEAKQLGLKPAGISFHVGSQASNPDAWSQALNDVEICMNQLIKEGITIEFINIGGGYPCAYSSDVINTELNYVAEKILTRLNSLPYKPKMMLEPGRGIIAETSIAVATIIGKASRKEGTWLFLDLGVYNGLFEALAFQGSTRYRVTSQRQSFNSGEMLYSLAGPTGDSMDVITREALLPKDLDVGDKIIFHDVGAYSLVVASPFNGFPKPAVYFV